MRRALLTLILTLAGTSWLAAGALGDEDAHTYKVELDNAFGIVEGSDFRVGGVNVGSVAALEISPEKRALITVQASGPLAVLGVDTTCTSEPQSLIAEYFIDCDPAGQPLPNGGTIPVEQTSQVVQADIFQDTFREPFRDRLRLLLNEFGGALAGNSDSLNAAIRRGAPALQELHTALELVTTQNRRIRNLAVDGDAILSRLDARRTDVVRFVETAGDAAAVSAERRDDLSRDFDLLDDFLAELQPAMAELGATAEEQTPLLADLRTAAPSLNRLALTLPDFAEAGTVSLKGLGEAGAIGEQALERSGEEIEQLRLASRNAPRLVESLSDFLRDITDPRRAVEVDARASRRCDDPTLPCWGTGRAAPTGYTALEGILNYAYYLTGATSQYDQVGHILHFSVYSALDGPCGMASTGHDPVTGEPGVPALGGGTTTNILEADNCVSWLGPNQPGINEELPLAKYDPSVCPKGTFPEIARIELCDPGEQASTRNPDRDGEGDAGPRDPGDPESPTPEGPTDPTDPGLPGLPGLPPTPELPGDLDEVLEDLPNILPDAVGGPLAPLGNSGNPLGLGKRRLGAFNAPRAGSGSSDGTSDLLYFLFGD